MENDHSVRRDRINFPLFLLLGGLLLVASLGIRVYHLSERPMHNDEGVNGWFVTNLVRDNNYKYDPNNYHGPSLYYFQLIPTWISTLAKDGVRHFSFTSIDGINDISLRISIVVVSLLVLVGLLCSFHRIGMWGAMSAAFFAATSCSMLYFSRYFIHEMYVVLFTLLIYLGVTYFSDRRKESFFYLSVLSVTFLYATKETSVLTITVLLIAWILSELLYFRRRNFKLSMPLFNIKQEAETFFEHLLIKTWPAFVCALLIWFFLYTSFGHNWKGLVDSFMTYFKWTKEGMESGHAKPFGYFFKAMIVPYEAGLLMASLAGLVLAFKKNDRYGQFIGLWWIGIFLVYSLIPYKTPWCVVNILLPMALLSGFAVQSLYEYSQTLSDSRNKKLFGALLLVATLGLGFCQVRQTYMVNYQEYDSESHPQSYVHTSRDVLLLVDRIREVGQFMKVGTDVRVNVVAKEYWPIPYYLRQFPSAAFWGRAENIPALDAPLLVADKVQADYLKEKLKGTYKIEEYSLRNNLGLDLYINSKNLPPEKEDVLPTWFPPVPAPASAAQGLVKRVTYGRRYNGNMIEEKMADTNYDFEWESADDRYPIPFSIVWTGYLKMDTDSAVEFSLSSDDGSQLLIDDHLVVDNDNLHATKSANNTINLKAGFHRVELRYFDAGGAKILHWTWKVGEAPEETVPAKVLFYERK